MAQSSGSVFPIEIYEEIIGFVCPLSSPKTLLSCALTCSAWVPQSQRCLYSYIHLHVKTEPGHGFTRLLHLIHTLRNNSTLRDMVQELIVNEEISPDVLAGVLHLGSILAAGIWAHLRGLTLATHGVKRFIDRNCRDIPQALAFHRSSFATLCNFPALETLRIDSAPLVFTEFCKLLSGIPSLRSLILDYVEWRNVQPPAHGWPVNKLPQLERLTVDRLGCDDHQREVLPPDVFKNLLIPELTKTLAELYRL